MEIITKAKKSCTAFEKPGSQKPGRGHPPKKGTAVHLKELFITLAGEFQETEIELYGKKESIWYYCIDLLWGQKMYQELRFVLVEMNGGQSVEGKKSRKKILEAVRAIEMHMALSCIAMGILQSISILYIGKEGYRKPLS